MEIDWDTAIEFVLKMEGGHVNDPDDPGGETRYGISKRRYPHLDIKNLTLLEAKRIYRHDFWDPCKCDDLPREFAISLFDMAVNMGISKAIRTLQVSLRLKDDGIVGPITIAQAHGSDELGLKRFLSERLINYHEIISKNTKLSKYARGWFYRVISLTILIARKRNDR